MQYDNWNLEEYPFHPRDDEIAYLAFVAQLLYYEDKLKELGGETAVFNKVFNNTGIDVRYSCGVEEAYAAAAGLLNDLSIDDGIDKYYNNASSFLTQTFKSWHEIRRWRFEPHKAWIIIAVGQT